ncbi:hypothetical protein [Nocardia sp. NPDC060259]|uniref:hypothetical protein n=1 Tax=Nocardia sp. NPDC060259 TaxID=3347088 RepID=UPI00365BE406
MVLSKAWTGFEAKALQDALRLSVREFAERVEVNPRTVSNWRAGGEAVKIRPFTAGSLDEMLRRADSGARERFDEFLGAGKAFAGVPDHLPRPMNELPVDLDLRVWIEMNRRELLQLFGGIAHGLPAVAAILAGLDTDERLRVEKVLITPSRVDAKAVDNIEEALQIFLAQNDTYGPHAIMPMVTGQIMITEALLRECPPALEQRLHGLHSNLSQLAGWMHFDLANFEEATRHYEDGRRSAHRAHDDALAALILCNLSYLQVCEGDPRVGIDHAIAAQNWARRVPDWRMQAYADDITAYAYAASGQHFDCMAALDAADATIAAGDTSSGPIESVAYFHGPGLASSIRSECLHRFGDGHGALAAAQDARGFIDPSHLRNFALVHLDIAHAYTDTGQIEGASAAISDSARLAVSCRSDRLVDRIQKARSGLDRWRTTTPVRTLDEELDSYGFGPKALT